MNLPRDSYELTDDKSRLDLDTICALLNATYWANDRTREVIQKSIDHSVCFGVFRQGKQIAFGRAISDYATYTYLCDVIVAPEHRGCGIGKWLVASMLAHPDLQTSSVYLRTRDAHELYRPLGFKDAACMRRGAGEDLCLPPGESSC